MSESESESESEVLCTNCTAVLITCVLLPEQRVITSVYKIN
jgi:hypothetical protein